MGAAAAYVGSAAEGSLWVTTGIVDAVPTIELSAELVEVEAEMGSVEMLPDRADLPCRIKFLKASSTMLDRSGDESVAKVVQVVVRCGLPGSTQQEDERVAVTLFSSHAKSSLQDFPFGFFSFLDLYIS